MFERICIPPKYPDRTFFDLGLLGEALVFYQEIIIILRYSSLKGLLKQCNPETLIKYLDHGRLKIKYLNNMLGAISRGENTPFGRYDFGLISSEKQNLENAAYELFRESVGKSGKGRRLADRFLKFVEPISYDGGITKQIVKEVQFGKYISEFVRRRLERTELFKVAESKNPIIQFGPLADGGFPLRTNLNFNFLSQLNLENKELKKPSTILESYGSTIADLSLWSMFDTEVAVNPSQSDVLQSRFDILLSERNQSDECIANFQDFVFDNGRALRTAINSGKKNLDDLFPIVEKSDQFSKWLHDQSPDDKILKSYYKEIVSDSWVNKLPSKTVRWALFTGAGLAADALGAGGIGTGVGVALSALDNFIIDKLLQGWKPNHFIHGELEKFVKG